tara:strand:+ start:102 stop:482 length:381 start_codon:yes stop_codon:yes gene_type:complete
MSKSVNMERLIQNLDNRLENMNNTGNKQYLPLTSNNNNTMKEANYTSIPQPIKTPQKQQLKTPVKKKINLFPICKRYVLIFLIFIVISHPEFDFIMNIEKLSNLYRLMLKAVVFVVILMILNNYLY